MLRFLFIIHFTGVVILVLCSTTFGIKPFFYSCFLSVIWNSVCLFVCCCCFFLLFFLFFFSCFLFFFVFFCFCCFCFFVFFFAKRCFCKIAKMFAFIINYKFNVFLFNGLLVRHLDQIRYAYVQRQDKSRLFCPLWNWILPLELKLPIKTIWSEEKQRLSISLRNSI